MTDTCSFNGCSEDAVTKLKIEDEEIPGCSQHLDQLAKGQTQETSNGPDQKLQSGSVHLDIWHNEDSPDTYSFKRFYTEDDGNNFKETQNMRPRDLSNIQALIRHVKYEEVEVK